MKVGHCAQINPIDSVLLEKFAKALEVCGHNETRYAQKPSSFQYCWVSTITLKLSECADRLKMVCIESPQIAVLFRLEYAEALQMRRRVR